MIFLIFPTIPLRFTDCLLFDVTVHQRPLNQPLCHFNATVRRQLHAGTVRYGHERRGKLFNCKQTGRWAMAEQVQKAIVFPCDLVMGLKNSTFSEENAK